MVSDLTMAPVVADLMEALGHPEAAENLRWGQRREKYDELAAELEASEKKVGELEERADDLETELNDERARVAAVGHMLVNLGPMVENLSAEIARIEVALDEACREVRAIIKAARS